LEPGYISDEATPHKVSPGLTQTLISTAREAMQMSLDRQWLLDPANAIEAGTAYIAHQARVTHLDPPLVAAAYNAGKLAYQNGSQNRWKLRQYPIGTGAHCDRFVQFFNDAVFVLSNHAIAPSVGLDDLLGGLAPAPRKTVVASPQASGRTEPKEEPVPASEGRNASGESAPPSSPQPAAPAKTAPPGAILSGKDWVSQFPGSRDVEDLEPGFGERVKCFIAALRTAGATVTPASTHRPAERAYLMHWSWRIVKQSYDPRQVPPKAGVDIKWWHGDMDASVRAAQEMVEGYSIGHLGVPPALSSRHIERKAIDMRIEWTGVLRIEQGDGSTRVITSTPRDGTNAELIEVGKTYEVIHFRNVMKDKPHWSTDGR
jgi:hypothetical protein